jgi:2-oxoisovalerate dehydrogenase E2 component (dihydrolipoyl transacylase)
VTQANKREVVQFRLSDIGEGIAEVNIKEWYVTVGQKVSQFDSICEVQSDKASVTITSKFDGVISKLHYDIDDIAKVGQPLVDIEVAAEDGASDDLVDEINDLDASGKTPAAAAATASSYKKSLATPAVRRLAMENKLDLNQIPGSGKDGRVMKEDILNYLQSKQQPQPAVTSPPPVAKVASPVQQQDQTQHPPAAVHRPPPTAIHEDQVVKLSPITRAMFKSMTKSLQIPHLGLSEEVDVGRLMQMKDRMRREGITFLPFFMKAASLALSEFPTINSCIKDESNDELILKADHNIGFALDTPAGLLVPNVKRVQDKSIHSISQEIRR